MSETVTQPRRNPVLTMLRLLCFVATEEELKALDNRHLWLGLLCVWVVGMGRWWDSPPETRSRSATIT